MTTSPPNCRPSALRSRTPRRCRSPGEEGRGSTGPKEPRTHGLDPPKPKSNCPLSLGVAASTPAAKPLPRVEGVGMPSAAELIREREEAVLSDAKIWIAQRGATLSQDPSVGTNRTKEFMEWRKRRPALDPSPTCHPLPNGEVIGPSDLVVQRPVSSGDDDPAGVTFAESPKYLALAEASTVGAVIVNRGQTTTKPSIQVDVPLVFPSLFQLLHLALTGRRCCQPESIPPPSWARYGYPCHRRRRSVRRDW